jgi:hypothetical protein
MPGSKNSIALAAAAIALLALCFFLARKNEGMAPTLTSTSAQRAAASTRGDIETTVANLEQRIRVLEDIIMGARVRRARSAQTTEGDSDIAQEAGQKSSEDTVTASLQAAIALQAEFDKEAGVRSRKSVTIENGIESALETVLANEQRYMPLTSSNPECRRNMCKQQYRFSDPSIAEYASTALLMELSGTFTRSDILTLPNEDGTYELLVYSHLK